MTTDIGELRARLLLESQQFRRGMQEARDQMNQTGKSAQQASQDFDRIQKASLAVGVAAVAGIGASVKTAADFEAQMSRVKAISGATDEEFKNLKDSALELGANTSKSASEVAVAFEDMAAAGFSANEIMAAMPGVIAAAEASGTDLALTSQVVTAALNGFKLEASEASRVADVLAMTANVSAASVDDLGYAFKYAAPIAQTLGISMEELAAATGIMVDAGMDGSQAGTTLRMALLRLADPTKEGAEALEKLGVKTKDANDKFIGLEKILPQFIKGLDGMSNAQKVAALSTIFGTEAATGMLTVIDGGVDQFNDFTEALENSSGASKEAANVMKDNLKGAVDEFQGALESVGIELGDEFLPTLTDIVKKGTDVVVAIGEMDSSTIKAGLAFGGTTAAIALTITTIGKLGIAVKGLMASMGPAGWLITGVSLLGGAIAAYTTSQEEATQVTMEHYLELDKQQKILSDTISVFDELQSKNKLTTDEMLRYMSVQQELQNTTDSEKIRELSSVLDVLQQRSGLSKDEINKLIEANKNLIEQAPETEKAVSETGQAFADSSNAAKELNAELLEMKRIELETQQARAEANMAEHIRDYQIAVNEVNDALAKRNEKLIEIAGIEYNLEQLEIRKKEAMKLTGAERDIALSQIEEQIFLQQNELQVQKDSYSELQNKYNERVKELGVADELLTKDKGIYTAINQNILASVGLTAERGKEKQKLDEVIAAEQKKRDEIIESAGGVGKLNAEQQKTVDKINEQIARYREAGSAIDSNTVKQNETNTKINDGKNKAEQLTTELKKEALKNIKFEGDGITEAKQITDELGKPVEKKVTIWEKTIRWVEELFSGGNKEKKHTGGIAGKRNPLEFHVGGVPAWLVDAPLHNEVDIRALPNEMILTEAQQANLFRMIDAGNTQNPSYGLSKDEASRAVPTSPIVLQTVLPDGRVIAEATYPDINRLLYQDVRSANRTGGSWKRL